MHYVCTTCFTNDVVMPFNNGWLTAFDESKLFCLQVSIAALEKTHELFETKNVSFIIVRI